MSNDGKRVKYAAKSREKMMKCADILSDTLKVTLEDIIAEAMEKVVRKGLNTVI